MSTRSTVISLRVRVPVLSEQITVTAPSASTAGRRRTMAWRAAMRCTPIARVMVMIAGSPSGIAATAIPTAARNMSPALNPRTSVPTAKANADTVRMTQVSTRLNPAIWRSSGVVRVATAPSIRLMRPISVRAPVATTTPQPCP